MEDTKKIAIDGKNNKYCMKKLVDRYKDKPKKVRKVVDTINLPELYYERERQREISIAVYKKYIMGLDENTEYSHINDVYKQIERKINAKTN